jgi:hypothetical protein
MMKRELSQACSYNQKWQTRLKTPCILKNIGMYMATVVGRGTDVESASIGFHPFGRCGPKFALPSFSYHNWVYIGINEVRYGKKHEHDIG